VELEGSPVTWFQMPAMLADIQRTTHRLEAKVTALSEQSAEIQQDVTDIEAAVAKINDGVARATALIQQLEAGQGQPIDPAVLASLKQAVADVSSAAAPVAGLAP
jgi:septal ring factor EnvC (AmiA/AmiB activator)